MRGDTTKYIPSELEKEELHSAIQDFQNNMKKLRKIHKSLWGNNRTLGKLLYLHISSYDLIEGVPDARVFDSFEAKRGKKNEIIPVKYAMKILGLKHRTASDYVHLIEAEYLVQKCAELKCVIEPVLKLWAKGS